MNRRLPSTDTPTHHPRRRQGRLKARITAHLYQVDFGRGSEWAYYPGTDLLDLGTDRTCVWDPVANQWWIRPFGGVLGYVIVAVGSSVGVSDPQKYKVIPVYPTVFGPISADGPEVAQYTAVLDVAPNGAFMVAAIDTATIGVFLWQGGSFATTPVDTVTVAQAFDISISPDSSTVALALSGSPYLQAYPVSVSGFGSPYSDPGTLPSGAGHGVDWHPSGEAVGLAWEDAAAMTLAVWAWAAGWGSKYADPASSFVGSSSAVHFSPDGAFVFVGRVDPGDSADGQYRIYEFDLGSGIGARIAASGAPIAGPIDGVDQSDFNGSLLALGSSLQYGFITYTFDGATIGDGVTNYFPADEFDYAWHLKFSNDGQYLIAAAPTAGTNPPFDVGRVTVFSVGAGGALTQIGTTYVDDADGDWPYLGWRDP